MPRQGHLGCTSFTGIRSFSVRAEPAPVAAFPLGVPEELPEILQLGTFLLSWQGNRGRSLQLSSSFSSHTALISAGLEFKSSPEQLVQGSVLGLGAVSLHLAGGWTRRSLRFLQTQSETL